MTNHRSLHLVLALGAVLAAMPRIVFADCAPVRPATAEEKKIYADGFALFQRMAPAAPAGWESNDLEKNAVLAEVCAEPGQKIIQHRFSRSYTLKDGMEARQAEAARKMKEVMQGGQATMKANEAKIADVQARIQALQAKMPALMAAKKYTEMEALGKQMEGLMEEQVKLMNVNAQDEAMKAIDAEANRDTHASFSLMLNVTDLSPGGFSPATVGTIKTLRQLTPAQGATPASADYKVVLNPSARGPQNVVLISGDPARAEALLKAVKLQ